jgi:hypothetical protein
MSKATKTIGLFALGMLFLIALASFSSAYHYGGYYDPYYGRGNYDSYHSYTTRTQGGYYGPRTTTSTNYDKVSERYWDGRSWVDRTTYTRVNRETPDCYYYGCYPGYQNSYYYGGYDYPNYNNRYYGNYYYPRSSYWGMNS